MSAVAAGIKVCVCACVVLMWCLNWWSFRLVVDTFSESFFLDTVRKINTFLNKHYLDMLQYHFYNLIMCEKMHKIRNDNLNIWNHHRSVNGEATSPHPAGLYLNWKGYLRCPQQTHAQPVSERLSHYSSLCFLGFSVEGAALSRESIHSNQSQGITSTTPVDKGQPIHTATLLSTQVNTPTHS